MSGPFKYNGVPLRRVNQRYVIATKTKIKIKKVRIPPQLGDEFFRRQDLRTKKSVDKIFAEEEKVRLSNIVICIFLPRSTLSPMIARNIKGRLTPL